MGDYGKVGIIGGYSQVNGKNYGKVGAEYSYQNSFDNNPDIGYKLAFNGNALIGKKTGFSAGAYAGLDFNKTDCTQYNVGLIADYTRVGNSNALAQIGVVPEDQNELANLLYDAKIHPHQVLRAGGEVGFTRNLCCDEGKKLHLGIQGGAEFTPKPDTQMSDIGCDINYSNKLNRVKPFIGANAEYSTVVNRNGNELFFRGNCQMSNHNSKGEIGIGFRF